MKTKDGKTVKVGDTVWCLWGRPVKIICQPHARSTWFISENEQNFIWLGDVNTGTYVHVGDVSNHYGDEKNAQAAAVEFFQKKIEELQQQTIPWQALKDAAASRLNEVNLTSKA